MYLEGFTLSLVRKFFTLKKIPSGFKNNNQYLYGQIYTTLLVLIIVNIIVFLYSLTYLILGNVLLSIIHAVNLVFVLLSFLIFSWNPLTTKALISNFLIFIQFVSALSIVLFTGGIESSTLIWFSFFPAIMVFMNGIKNAIYWFISSIFVFSLLYIIQIFNIGSIFFGYSTFTDRFMDTSFMALTAILMISAVDISRKRNLIKLKESESKLKILATTDPLTKLLNRRSFEEKAEIEIKRSNRYNKPLTLLMLDLDHFKKINDNNGHKTGDYVLQEVSKIFKKNLRDIDLIGRYGGEEFIMMFPESDQKTTYIAAERIRKDIENADSSFNGNILKITISIGITQISNNETESLDSLTYRADEALYLSKKHGRNTITIWSEI